MLRKQDCPQSCAVLLPAALFLLTLVVAAAPAWPHDHSDHAGHEEMSLAMEGPANAAVQAKLLADKRESEFNHHLAGFFVLLGGIFLMAEKELRQRWLSVRFAWPASLLLAGIFVLIWSDTELWPFGPQNWGHALVTNTEVQQHKTFAAILLALGGIELQKVRGRLRSAWARWVFPVLAIGGSVLLLFHTHQAGMHGPNHMELMARIQSEHLSYAITGVGIALTKGLSETRTSWQELFQRFWPSLLMVLGALLMIYVE